MILMKKNRNSNRENSTNLLRVRFFKFFKTKIAELKNSNIKKVQHRPHTAKLIV